MRKSVLRLFSTITLSMFIKKILEYFCDKTFLQPGFCFVRVCLKSDLFVVRFRFLLSIRLWFFVPVQSTV